MVIGLAIYYIFLRVRGKKQTAGHVIASFVFCFYLVGILTITGVCLKGSFSPRFVFIPFVDMIRGPVDTALNILLFIPLGVFLPLLYEEFNTIGKIFFVGFLISLSVEVAQMFSTGATDINDLITNTVGACVGFGFFKLLCKTILKSWLRQIQAKGAQCYYELVVFWIGSMLMMLTVQVDIFHALFPSGMASGEMQEWK